VRERLGVTTLYIEPDSPWENGYIKSFNARLPDELLYGEIFYSLEEVRPSPAGGAHQTNRATGPVIAGRPISYCNI
jgi:hypothetical protein